MREIVKDKKYKGDNKSITLPRVRIDLFPKILNDMHACHLKQQTDESSSSCFIEYIPTHLSTPVYVNWKRCNVSKIKRYSGYLT